jgi:REP element-mobilizing transposase RayT
MPQKRIPLELEQIYHIWTHANGSENLFRAEENYHYFLDRYIYHVHPVVETFAYCLMANHLHLMVRIRGEEVMKGYLESRGKDLTGFENLSGLVSKQFSNLFNAYTKAYNKKYDRRGALFERAFKRKLVDSNEYFARLIAYIHNNPVHHGFVEDLNDWPHSSWHAYVFDKSTRVNKEDGMAWFGGRKNFIEVHRQINMEKLMSVFEE